jgi:regulator of replication initiation timing
MIIKLYQGIVKSNDLIKSEIEKISDPEIKHKTIKIIKQLSYVILNYSLRLIAQISLTIKNDDSKKQLKDTLMRHSVMIVHKLNNFMRDEIEEKTHSYKLLQDDLMRIGGLKIEICKKIAKLDSKINSQSSQLLELKNKITNIMSENKNFVSELNNASFQLSNTDNNSSYMFEDDDCHFSDDENNTDIKISYLSEDK